MKEKVNERLLNIQKEWLKIIDADEKAKKYPLSRPFSFAVTEQYMQSGKKVMIIGQQTADFGGYYTNKWPMDDIHRFNYEYVNRQVRGMHEAEYEYNRSAFWNLFRKLVGLGIEPVWNNLEKFHFVGEKEKTIPLNDENLKKELCGPYGNDRKSLLCREIEISSPKAVVFTTGPYYSKTMADSFGIDEEKLQKAGLCKDNCFLDISDIIKIGVPTIWSYHPAYLQRIRSLDKIVEFIKASV
jgi:hypothetical protein